MNIGDAEVPGLDQALLPLAFFNEGEFERFQLAIASPRRFLLNKNAIKQMAADLGRDEETVGYLLSALGLLQNRFQQSSGEKEFVRAKQTLVEIIDSQADLFDGADVASRLAKRLDILLEYSPEFSRYVKAARISRGFLANATGFSTFVDLRANFSDTDAISDPGELDGFSIVIQCRLRTVDAEGKDQSVTFQVNEEVIDEMIEALMRATSKVAVIKAEATKISEVL
tara:strand:- start:832 stop:1512 length:681 start_codon:yes stop_codon:yes gene_type:complete